MKTVYILRGVPGSGKSTFADQIKEMANSSNLTFLNCCSDDYFTDEKGNYVWREEDNEEAYEWSDIKFEKALDDKYNIVISSNPNCSIKDVEKLRNIALSYGYLVFVVIIENRHEGRDIHNVPEWEKTIMRTLIQTNMKL